MNFHVRLLHQSGSRSSNAAWIIEQFQRKRGKSTSWHIIMSRVSAEKPLYKGIKDVFQSRCLALPALLGAFHAQDAFSTPALELWYLSTLALKFSTFQLPRERFSEHNPRPRLRWNSHHFRGIDPGEGTAKPDIHCVFIAGVLILIVRCTMWWSWSKSARVGHVVDRIGTHNGASVRISQRSGY